jgi:ABC-2 type transport system ATP-binding protein
MEPLVAGRDLVRRFGDFTAVDSVSLEVRGGEVVGLLGANGAGKTTTIRMLIGLLVPSSGAATLLGGAPDTSARHRLGYVPQGLGLYADLTAAENMAFVAGSYGVPTMPLPEDLAADADRLVGELSLGLQRQLAFACALQHRPDILILDEPTSGVGPLGAAHLWDQIRTEAERGAGALVSTHSMQEARECDRLILMADGRVVASGSEADIVGDTGAVLISTEAWTVAFDVLERAGEKVTLDGRAVRVADGDIAAIRRHLAEAGVSAVVTGVPATLDEKMVSLARRQAVG